MYNITELEQKLSPKVSALKSRAVSLSENLSSLSPPQSQSPPPSAATHRSPNKSVISSRTQPPSNHGGPPHFNVVVSGVAECAQGTSRHARLSSDFDNIVSIIDRLQCDVPSSAVRDCRRLGRFSPSNSRPRPLLVTLNRSRDVVSILSKCGSSPAPYVIKPFLSKKERHIESLLLNERWRLIQSGTAREDIRLSKTSLFVNGELYATVTNTGLSKVNLLSPSLASDSSEPDTETPQAQSPASPASDSSEPDTETPQAQSPASPPVVSTNLPSGGTSSAS